MTPHVRAELSGLQHLYPFRSHYLRRNGLAYHFVDEGAGEPLVMLHGNPTWSFYYRALIKGLSDRYRTIVPDHIGCGLSDVPGLDRYDYRLESRVSDLEYLVDQLELDRRITLIVHDWGGMIGMAFALRHPEKIARIVIMNTAAFFPPGGKKLPLRLRLIRNLPPLAAVAVRGFNLFALGALFMATRKGLSPDVRKGLTAPYNSWQNRIATLKFVQDIPLTAADPSYGLVRFVDTHLDRLTHPAMLILWGMHDFVFDTAYLMEWRRRFPQATVFTFPHAGHYILEDEPQQILARIDDFLTRHPLTPGADR